MKNIIDKYALSISVILSVIGFIVIILFALVSPFNNGGEFNSELFSQYGDFIGGFVGALFSLAGFFLLYKTLILQKETLKEQKNAIDEQRNSFEQERFESTFFNLVNYQKEIKKDLIHIDFKKNKIKGKKVIDFALEELRNIWNSLTNSRYCIPYNEDMYNNIENEIQKYRSDGYEGDETVLQTYFSLNENYNITNKIWNIFQGKELKEEIQTAFEILYNIFGNQISEYLKNFFLIIEFIDRKKKTNAKFQYEFYIDILKQQLNTSELIFIFYASFFNDKYRYINEEYEFFKVIKTD